MKFVPLISSSTAGPLGICHLPRMWLKILLHATGKLPEGYRHGTGGADEKLMDDLGIDRDAFIAFVESQLPSYLECEAWVREHATNLNPTSIAKANEVARREKPEAMAAAQRVYIGIDDPGLRNATLLNDLDDWTTLHAYATKGTFPPLAASSLNAALTEILKVLLDETKSSRAALCLEMPRHGFELAKVAAEAKRPDLPPLLGKELGNVNGRSVQIHSNGNVVALIALEGGSDRADALERAAARAQAIIESVRA